MVFTFIIICCQLLKCSVVKILTTLKLYNSIGKRHYMEFPPSIPHFPSSVFFLNRNNSLIKRLDNKRDIPTSQTIQKTEKTIIQKNKNRKENRNNQQKKRKASQAKTYLSLAIKSKSVCHLISRTGHKGKGNIEKSRKISHFFDI